VPLVIAAPPPADLAGTTLAVTPSTATWGSTITLTAQITNQGAGASPQTEALLNLTPQGLTYGGTTTVGIGTLVVPPLAPYQTVNLVQNITLPAVEPLTIANYTNFGLSMTQDANYVTNSLFPHQPTQGAGYDQTPITITYSATNPVPTTPPLPDLAAATVLGPTRTERWGQSFPVTTNIQNLGQAAAGSFQVFFLLTGAAGSLNDALYLGQATIPGLPAGGNQQITQTLTLPTRVPSGMALDTVGYGRVTVLVDPNNFINESLKSNNDSISAPFIVRLPGSATSVPTGQAPGTVASIATVAQQDQNRAKRAAAAVRAAKVEALLQLRPKRKLRRHPAPKTDTIPDKVVSVGKELYKLPTQVFNAIKRSV
jgi:hypothetical protein